MADISFKAELNLAADKAKRDVKDVSKEVDKVQKSTKKAADTTKKGFGGAIKGATDGLRQMGTVGSGAFGQVASAIGMGSKAAMGFKAALAATGIGLVVVAIGALVAGFTRLQANNDKLTRSLAGLKAVFDVIMDTIGFLATAIVDAFTNPREALETLTNGVQEYYNWLKALGTLIITSIIITFEKMRLGILRAAAATKEFFGADASELRAEIAATEASIRDLEATALDAAKAVVQPFVDMAKAVSDFREELGRAADAAQALRDREIALEKTQIRAIESQARRNKEIARLRLLYQEEGRSLEEREAALRGALELEQQNLDERLAMAREEARIITERNALSESTREDQRKEAEARARVIELEEQSLSFRRRIVGQLRGLADQREAAAQREIEAEQKAHEARMSALDEINKALFDAQATQEEQELAKAAEKFDKLLDLADQHNLDRLELEEQYQLELEAIQQKFREQRALDLEQQRMAEHEARQSALIEQFDLDRQLAEDRLWLANSTINAIEGLSELAFKGDEERAKRAFNVMKALRIGESVASTYSAASAVLADPTIPTVAKPKFVAGVIAQGIANTAKIAAQQFGGGASGISTPELNIAADDAAPPPNITALQQGAQQDSIQAFVIEQNVSNSQQANQRIKEVSAL